MDLILQQMQYFLASFLCGVLLFFLYDFLRILRLLIAHSLLMNLIEDLIFWIAASILTFQMIFRENDGILRVFSIVAFVAGMYGYFRWLEIAFLVAWQQHYTRYCGPWEDLPKKF